MWKRILELKLIVRPDGDICGACRSSKRTFYAVCSETGNPHEVAMAKICNDCQPAMIRRSGKFLCLRTTVPAELSLRGRTARQEATNETT